MTSITDTEQAPEGTTAPPDSPSPTPRRSARSVFGWLAVVVVLVATATLGVAVFLTAGSSAESDRPPATTTPVDRATPDLVERWAESRQRTLVLLEACRRGEISEFSGIPCPAPIDPPGRQPRNAN